MRKIELVDIDLEEKKLSYNANLTRFFTVFALSASLGIILLTSDASNSIMAFGIFALTVLMATMVISLNRILRIRDEIKNLFDEKRKIINKR